MDGFALVIFGGGIAVVLVFLALGKWYPGTGAEQLDWKPTRSAETEVRNEIDDLDQMLEAANARRRARGAAELTEDGLHAQVREHTREQTKRRDDYMADLEIAQMLDATNARRRDRGQPELSLDQLRAELGL